MRKTRPSVPFDDEADAVALVQDALELGDSVGAGPLEGDLVGDADDLHGSGVAGDLAVGDGDHVVQTQSLSCGEGGAEEQCDAISVDRLIIIIIIYNLIYF